MAGPTTSFSLGKSYGIFVGKTAASTADTDFTQIINENTFSSTYKADADKVVTKAGGQITIPQGDESLQIKGTADIVFADPALKTLVGSKNQSWPYQIRNITANTVHTEGNFIVTDVEWKNEAKGVTQITFTMENSSVFTIREGNERAVGSASSGS